MGKRKNFFLNFGPTLANFIYCIYFVIDSSFIKYPLILYPKGLPYSISPTGLELQFDYRN